MPDHPRVIDLRSDTVTAPSAAMREAMAKADTGDDVYGEDPTIKALEARAAELTGKQAALFCPTGTQSNLIALLSHCQRGDEYLVGDQYHTYKFEGGGAAVLGSIQPQPIPLDKERRIPLDAIAARISDDDIHLAKTRLLALENTCGGYSLPLDYLALATGIAREHGLATHLDGARLFNAAIDLDVSAASIAENFDSVSVCLSKGLGAPVGSVLCGSPFLIKQALRWRKMTGGGMRQAGIIAAAGIYALDNNIERLAEDHKNAALLSELLQGIDNVEIDGPHSNMVHMKFDDTRTKHLIEYAGSQGLKLSGRYGIRIVTHLDVDADDIRQAARIIRTGLS